SQTFAPPQSNTGLETALIMYHDHHLARGSDALSQSLSASVRGRRGATNLSYPKSPGSSVVETKTWVGPCDLGDDTHLAPIKSFTLLFDEIFYRDTSLVANGGRKSQSTASIREGTSTFPQPSYNARASRRGTRFPHF
ncbi:6894_t:CDS:2, partial [Acaulospora colombiana]